MGHNAIAAPVHTIQPLWTDARPALSVVIPCYNPGNALRVTVSRLLMVLRSAGVSFEIITVDDGSTDGSIETVRGLDDAVVVLQQPRNMGKGAALHRGFAAARGSWVGFVDADGDIDPVHVLRYLRVAERGRFDAVYADKRHAASQNQSTALRKLVSVGFATLAGMMFRLGVRDTQTGCKVISREAMATVLPLLREQRFAFDLEFFVVARQAGLRNMVGEPVTIEPREAGSTVTVKALLRTVRDMVTIWGRRARGQYRTATVTELPGHGAVRPVELPAFAA